MSLGATRYGRLAELHQRMRSCQLCVKEGYIATATPLFSGRADDPIMVIGQAPGHVSVAKGIPFSGPGGVKLGDWLHRAGFSGDFLHQRVYLSSLTKCDPGPNAKGDGDRKPSRPELDLCRPYLLEELELVQPRVVLLVGQLAIQEMVGPARLQDAVGSKIERDGITWLPLPHPSGVSRWLNSPANQALLDRALEMLGDIRRAHGVGEESVS